MNEEEICCKNQRVDIKAPGGLREWYVRVGLKFGKKTPPHLMFLRVFWGLFVDFGDVARVFFWYFPQSSSEPNHFPRWNPWLDEFGRWAELESRPRLDAGKFPPVLCDFVAQCLRRDDTKCLSMKQKSPGRWRFQDWDFGESTLYTNKNWLIAPDTPPKMVPFLP